MNINRTHCILVVEDEGHVAGFIRDALTEIGYAVTVAAGGADALNKVSDDAPDLVLLDLNLPDMPGFEVLDRLCARSPALPVVIVSGNTDPMMAEAALALGAVDYVTKPFALGPTEPGGGGGAEDAELARWRKSPREGALPHAERL